MSSSSAGSGDAPELSLSGAQIAELFPFHVVFDTGMRLIQAGRSMMKLLPALVPGSDISKEWVLESPAIRFCFEEIRNSSDALFIIRTGPKVVRLRGQMVALLGRERMVFLCSPWLPEPGQFRETGLTFNDFPLHDSMPEFVQVVQSQRFGIEDLRKLTERLREQRERLKETNLRLIAQSLESRKLALIAARTDNGVVVTDAQGCVEWVNEGFVRMTGYTLEELQGRTPGSLLQGPQTNLETLEYIRRQLRKCEGFQCELLNYHKSGRKYWISIEVQPIRDDSGQLTNFMAIESDITAEKDSTFRRSLAYSVSTILAEATGIDEALRRILRIIVEAMGNRFSVVWWLDATRNVLFPRQVWSVAALYNSYFERATRSREFRVGVGLPGAVWQANAPVWMPDLSKEPTFVRRQSAAEDGLRCGFAFPIRVGGRPCGVMEFFGTGGDRPDDELLQTLTALGNQIGQFIDRQDAEGERRRLVSLLRSTLESTTDGILVVDLQRRFVTWNHKFLEMWGIDDELIASGDHAAVRLKAAQKVSDPLEFMQRVQGWYERPEELGSARIHLKDGRVFEETTQPQRNERGVIGRVWSYRDATHKWLAEQALTESEEQYRIITSTASDGIISVNRMNTIVFANPAAERMFGYESGELVNRNLADLMSLDYRKLDSRGLMRVVLNASKNVGSKTTEITGLKRNGTELPLEITFGKAHIRGERVLTGVLRDISARRQFQDAQQQAMKEIEAANQAKSNFLANISHEIRTPLNSIAGLTELLRETRLDDDQRDMINTIWAGSESLLHLINDLLDVSKIEAGQVDIAFEKFDVVQVCERALEIVKTRTQHKGLVLTCSVQPLPTPSLMGDANRIAQILVNLLSNGVKFTEHGSVSLEVHWKCAREGIGSLEFHVQDTGIGIRSEDSDKVFEKFYRVNTRVGRQAGGTGLGLSITRLLAAAMGGSVTLASEEGRGSRFTFQLELPLASVIAVSDQEPVREVALLLAEPGISPLLQKTWESAGLRVLPFDKLSSAIAHLDADELCDIVLLQSWADWDLDELRRFFRTLALRGKVRCVRMRAPDGSAMSGWTPNGLIDSIDFPLTPTRMRLALSRLNRDSDSTVAGRTPELHGQDVGTPSRVLLVEDNVDSAAYARRVLARANHEVTFASTVAEALQCARTHRFDVIFMDVMLPDGSGFDASRKIREYEQAQALARVPIVALTAHALQGHREEAFSVEIDEYLTKPVRPEALLGAVKKWSSERQRGPEITGKTNAMVLVDPDLSDMIPDYLARIGRDVERICELAREGKTNEVKTLGHNLSGSGGGYGFHEISRLGRLIESLAKAGNLQAAEQAGQALRVYLKEIKWCARSDNGQPNEIGS